VDHARLHVAGGGVPAVVQRHAAAHAGADFGEVQANAIGATHAVVLGDDNVRHVDAHRAGRVQDDPPDGVVDDPAGERGAHAQPRQRVGDVELTAADAYFQRRAELDASMP